MTPIQVREFHVEFVCPTRTFEELPAIEQLRAIDEEVRPIKEALASIDLHTRKWDFARGRRYTHRMICWTYNLELSAESVRNALSGLEAFYVIGVRKGKTRNLPALKRPRKAKPNPLPPCDCEDWPFCPHTPKLSEAEQLAKWKREDATIRQRQSRVTHNRIGAGRAKK